MISSLVLFIVPERTAKTDHITDSVGYGSFKFVREELELGHKAVYVRTRTTSRAARRRIG